MYVFFFFQAEDGIRDDLVTGVQTCALPIYEMLDQVTHLNSATGPLFKAAGDPRMTPVGNLLRRCFFDELPQLVNVLLGEMSLVGPRPCLPAELAQMHQFRFDAPQGVTGPWQVNGHHALTWEEQAN